MIIKVALGISLIALLVWDCNAYPFGAPITRCNDPYPAHAVAAQTSPSPYTITVSPTSYSPGDIINVTITAASPNEFKGFTIGAHSTGGLWETLYGNFTFIPDGTTPHSYYSDENDINCVTHGSIFSSGNRTSAEFQWQAPQTSVGDLVFSAAVVKDYKTFWNSLTAELKATVAGTPTPSPLKEADAFDDSLNDTNCTVTSGCITSPSNCSGTDCQSTISYVPVTGGLRFRLTQRGLDANSFMAMGISDDNLMPRDETFLCGEASGKLVFANGFNPDRYNVKVQTTSRVMDVIMSNSDGQMMCEFTVPNKGSVNYYDGANALTTVEVDYTPATAIKHLYMAQGPQLPGSKETFTIHTAKRVSAEKLSLDSLTRSCFAGECAVVDTTTTSTSKPVTTPKNSAASFKASLFGISFAFLVQKLSF